MPGTDPRSLPKTIDGTRKAWSIVEQTWTVTLDRARRLGEAQHERVNGEWSFVETLRHLLFVTDAWIGRSVLGHTRPYHPLGLPPDHGIGEPEVGVDVSGWGIDVFAVASVDEVVAARAGRVAIVQASLDQMTPGMLERSCPANTAPGFPPSTAAFTIGFCFELVIGEEWAHHEFATRDLALLEG